MFKCRITFGVFAENPTIAIRKPKANPLVRRLNAKPLSSSSKPSSCYYGLSMHMAVFLRRMEPS